MSVDEHALGELIEQSADLQADAMHQSTEALKEMVEVGHDRRRTGELDPEQDMAAATRRQELMRKSLLGAGTLAAAGFGAAVLGLFDTPAFADSATDIQMLQTAASLENLGWPPIRPLSPCPSSEVARPMAW